MKIALHICCGVCAAGAVKKLKEEGHQVFGFFYNPNIYPEEEYQKRLKATYKVAHELHFPLEIGIYDSKEWFKETEHFKQEPEGGKRCEVCFKIRLKNTYHYMINSGLDAFTTTLTISPYKRAEVINKIGREIGRDRFLVRNFKKREGFKIAIQLAKQWHLYQQNYCGCIYSMSRESRSRGLKGK
ncbi:epoxyqueuosine reductase QueH [Candidatus Aerophobetes bacterium]|nr:epoxyqueuosine reductase QueH [Candidatus Aerophobetes bacterium]